MIRSKRFLNSLDVLAGMLSSLQVNKEKMQESTEKDFSNATELADYLAGKGLPFREAHEVVGRLVLDSIKSAKKYSRLDFGGIANLSFPHCRGYLCLLAT